MNSLRFLTLTVLGSTIVFYLSYLRVSASLLSGGGSWYVGGWGVGKRGLTALILMIILYLIMSDVLLRLIQMSHKPKVAFRKIGVLFFFCLEQGEN